MSRDRNAGYTQQPSPLISSENLHNLRTNHALLANVAAALVNNAKNILTDKEGRCQQVESIDKSDALFHHSSDDVCG